MMTALKYICSALKTTYSILSNNVNVNFFKPKLQKCSTKVAIALVSNLAKLNKNEVFIGLSVFYYLGWLFFIYTKKNIFIQKKHFVYTTLLILINNTSKIFNKITVNNEKKVNLSKFFKVREATIAVAVMFKSSLNYFWPTRYKFNIDFKSILPNTVRTFFKVYFLRKNKIFNKNRYARNRQSCRVIVYWTLWLNIFCIYGLYFYYYQFVFNFGYLWFGLFFFFGSFAFITCIRYNLLSFSAFYREFQSLCKWYLMFIKSFL